MTDRWLSDCLSYIESCRDLARRNRLEAAELAKQPPSPTRDGWTAHHTSEAERLERTADWYEDRVELHRERAGEIAA